MKLVQLGVTVKECDLHGLNPLQRAYVPRLRLGSEFSEAELRKLSWVMQHNRFMPGANGYRRDKLGEMLSARSDIELLMLLGEDSDKLIGYAMVGFSPKWPHPDPEFVNTVSPQTAIFSRAEFAGSMAGHLPRPAQQPILQQGDAILFSYGIRKPYRGSGRARTLIAGARALAREAHRCTRLVAAVSGVRGRGGASWDRATRERLVAHGFGEFCTAFLGNESYHLMQVGLVSQFEVRSEVRGSEMCSGLAVQPAGVVQAASGSTVHPVPTS